MRVRGRGSLLRKLRRNHRDGGLVVLVGADGAGKTTVARELVRRGGLPRAWEVSAAGLAHGLRHVAEQLGATREELEAIGVSGPTGPDHLWRVLERAPQGWILIVEDADVSTLAGAAGWLRAADRGLVVVTSRRWAGSGRVYRVDPLGAAHAAQVLLDQAPQAGGRLKARALGTRLGRLPLALHLAGRYLGSAAAVHADFGSYRRALETASISELSLDALAKRGMPQAGPLLRLLACYAPAVHLPLKLLRPGLVGAFLTEAAPASPGAPRPRVDQVLQSLAELGLVEPGSAGLVVHSLVAVANRAQPGDGFVWRTAVALMAAALDGLDPEHPPAWPAFRALAPHLRALLENAAPRLERSDLDTLVRVTGNLAIAYGYMGSPGLGIELIGPALGNDAHPIVLTQARQQLGSLLADAGRATEAEEIFRDVLRVFLRDRPADHPTCLAVRHNLASAGRRRADWAQAFPAFEALLEDERRVLGDDHPTTLRTRLEFAELHGQADRWSEAEELLWSVVDDAERVHGEDHGFVGAARDSLTHAIRRRRSHDHDDDSILPIFQPITPTLHEQFAAFLFHKGVTLKEEARDEEAVQVLDELIRRFGGDESPQIQEIVGEALFRKADALRGLGRLEEAVRAFGAMAERHAGADSLPLREFVAQALFHQADLLGTLEGEEEAAAAYEDLIERYAGDPSPKTRGLVAMALVRKGICQRDSPELAMRDLARAVGHYQELAEENPEEYTEKLASATVKLNQMRILAATNLFEQAVVLGEQGDRAQAVAAYEDLDARYAEDPSPVIRKLVAKEMLNRAGLLTEIGRESRLGTASHSGRFAQP